MLINELTVPDYFIDNNKDDIILMNEREYNDYLNKLKNRNLETKNGSSATIYFDGDEAIKVYTSNPILLDRDNLYPVATGHDVVNNIFYLLGNYNENAAIPNKIYVVDGKLAMYKARRIKMPRIVSIKRESDILVSELKSSWINAYKLSEYFSNMQIVMYDLNSHNSFINSGNFKVCDLDFYSCELFENAESKNYELVNSLFTDFIERYLFFENLEIKEDKYLVQTNNYVDYVFDELECITGTLNPKTLKDIVR